MSQLYTDIRREYTATDWPYGSARTTATFSIEVHPTRGERIVRTIINPRTGRACKPIKSTYSDKCALATGEDGRTYCLHLSRGYGMIGVMNGTMKTQAETIHERDDRFLDLAEKILLAT